MNDQLPLEVLLVEASDRAIDREEPHVHLRDLESLCRILWGWMTPSQRKKMMASDEMKTWGASTPE